jgi:hypothetical protein
MTMTLKKTENTQKNIFFDYCTVFKNSDIFCIFRIFYNKLSRNQKRVCIKPISTPQKRLQNELPFRADLAKALAAAAFIRDISASSLAS